MVLVAQRSETQHPAVLEDLLALPSEGQGYEIIDGELVQKETSPKHGGVQLRFGSLLRPYNRRPGGRLPGGWIFATEVLIDFGSKQILRPDVAGWRRERLPELPAEPVLQVLPDWTCEILSPSNASNDLVKKKRVYHQRQVPHYWIIDPLGETLTVHRWSPDGYVEVLSALRGERVRAEPFAAIELNVGVFFGDDEEE
jgi:Uma2 family endonuclease